MKTHPEGVLAVTGWPVVVDKSFNFAIAAIPVMVWLGMIKTGEE